MGWRGERVLARLKKFPTARVVSEPSGGRRCSVRLGGPHCAHARWRERAAPTPRRLGAGFGRRSPVFRVFVAPCGRPCRSWESLGKRRARGWGWGRTGRIAGRGGDGQGSGLHLPRKCPRACSGRQELLLGSHPKRLHPTPPSCKLAAAMSFPGSRSSAGSSPPSASWALSGARRGGGGGSGEEPFGALTCGCKVAIYVCV